MYVEIQLRKYDTLHSEKDMHYYESYNVIIVVKFSKRNTAVELLFERNFIKCGTSVTLIFGKK